MMIMMMMMMMMMMMITLLFCKSQVLQIHIWIIDYYTFNLYRYCRRVVSKHPVKHSRIYVLNNMTQM